MNRRLIHRVFEHQVDITPHHTAIEEEEGQISYHALNAYANRLAHLLRSLEDRNETITGVVLSPGIDHVASVLAIFKSGGIYLPLTLDTPAQRLQAIFTKTRPRIIVMEPAELAGVLSVLEATALEGAHVVLLDRDDGVSVRQYTGGMLQERDVSDTVFSPENLIGESLPDDYNYIFYTSGSTGEPKAIAGCHKSLSHFIHWEMQEFGVDETFRVSQLIRLTFDASLRDIFTPLCAGGVLVAPSSETAASITRLIQWATDRHVTLIHCVPALARLIVKELQQLGEPGRYFKELRHLLMAGEMLYGKDIIDWHALYGGRVELVNLYGPSESTMIKTFHRIKGVPKDPGCLIHVGQPISNTSIIIANRGQLALKGEIAEVYIKTPFLSKGYYGEPERTAESFVQNPLHQDSVDLVYRTGDLGRYLDDHQIEIVGRQDSQVKVNGIRMELGEIEGAVLACESVDQARVIVKRDQDQNSILICYYTEKRVISAAELTHFLSKTLPKSMIPSVFVRLEQFPIGLNGKVDVKALPQPEELLYDRVQYEPPKNALEEELALVWKNLLRLDKVGRKHSFFELGGNSLMAAMALGRIYRALHVEVKLNAFFQHSTLELLANHIRSLEKTGFVPIEPIAPQPYYDLSPAQNRLWVLHQIADVGNAYSMPGAYLFEGMFDADAFKRAVETVVARHDSLRTTFVIVEGEPKQKITEPTGFHMAEMDLSQDSDPMARGREAALKDAEVPFDLEKGPLVRASLLKLSGAATAAGHSSYLLLFNIHHLISDDWSMGILVDEVLTLYKHYVNQQEPRLPELKIQYRDYAAWFNDRLDRDIAEAHSDYWKDKLSGDLPRLDLPTDKPRLSQQSFVGETLRSELDQETVQALNQTCATHGVSLFMILVSVVKTLLFRYTAQDDIIVGVPAAGRVHPDLEDQIGFYVNLLPVRDQLNGANSFLEVLTQVSESITEAFDHQAFPFEQIVEELNHPRELSHSAIFDVMAVMHDQGPEVRLQDVTITEIDGGTNTSKYDLSFHFEEKEDTIGVAIEYNSELFGKPRIQRMLTHFEILIQEILQDPHKRLNEFNLITPRERESLCERYHETVFAFDETASIGELFEQQVNKTPEAAAVTWGDLTLSYDRLNAYVNALVLYLRRNCHVREGDRVAIMIDRTWLLPVAIMGIIKTGGAYVPIDPEFPPDRIAYMLENSGCQTLITEEKYMTLLPQETQERGGGYAVERVIDLGHLDCLHSLGSSRPENPDPVASGGSLAYVMYTSGSLGQPKGVMITHQNVVSFSLNLEKTFELESSDSIYALTTVSFDISVLELISSLLVGMEVVIAPEEVVQDPEKIVEGILHHGVNVLQVTPSRLRLMLEVGALDALRRLKTLIVGGEVFPRDLRDRIKPLFGVVQVLNVYGPTETTIWSTCGRVNETRLNIGTPLLNESVLILSETGKLVPVGYPGEICIGGKGVGNGYLNRLDLTAKNFMPHPFNPGETLYRTGDLGMWSEAGELEYIGRLDFQVKFRGYRIELGEIEHAMKTAASVGEAVVVLRQDAAGDDALCAYVVSDNNMTAATLRQHVSRTLPGYMIPSFFMFLDEIPLSPNGKIDRKALPVPDGRGRIIRDVTEPTTDAEVKIKELWQEVLGLEELGVHDNFFDLGGNSMKLVRLYTSLGGHFPDVFKMSDLFSYPTINQMAGLVSANNPDAKDGSLELQEIEI